MRRELLQTASGAAWIEAVKTQAVLDRLCAGSAAAFASDYGDVNCSRADPTDPSGVDHVECGSGQVGL